MSNPENKNHKVLVGNLSTSIDEEQLQELFTQTVGTVVSVSIPVNSKTKKNYGYAFVEMQTQAEAEQAVLSLNKKDLGGRLLNVTLAEQPEDSHAAKRPWYKFGAD